MLYRTIVAAFLAVLCACSLALGASSGPFRGPQNNGVYEASGLLTRWPAEGPTLLWKADVGEGFSGVTVADGTVYATGGVSGMLQAYTLDGELKWKAPFGNCSWKRFSGTRSTPLVYHGVVVCTTPAAAVVGLDLKTGAQRWTLNAWTDFGSKGDAMGWGYPSTPTTDGERLFLNTVSRSDETPPIVAADIATGKIVWKTDPLKGKRYSCGDGSASYFVHNGRGLSVNPTYRAMLCLDPKTGERLWEIPDADPEKGSGKNLQPVYSDGYLAFDMGGALIMGTLNEDGSAFTEVWRRPYKAGFAQAVILDKRLYTWGSVADKVTMADANAVAPAPAANATGSGLLCIDVPTGQVLACLPTNGAGHVIAADGMIYALDFKGVTMRLIAPTEAGMELRGLVTLPMTDADRKLVKELEYQANINPVIAEGRLFIRYGPLWVYDLRPDPPAQTWRGDGQGHYPYMEPIVEWTRAKHLRWETPIAGVSLSQPVPAGDRVFATAAPGTLLCLDMVTGEVLWRKSHGKGDLTDALGAITTPAVRDGRVYAVLGDGVAVCYALDGTLQWETKLGVAGKEPPLVVAPVLAGDCVVLQSRSLIALDAATGQERWRQASRAAEMLMPPTPARVGDALVLVTSDGRVVRASDGRVMANLPFTSGTVRPVTAGGLVYMAGPLGDASAIGAYRLTLADADTVTVDRVWQRDWPTRVPAGQLLAHGGLLYLLNMNDLTLSALDNADGSVVYTSPSFTDTVAKSGARMVGGPGLDLLQAGDHLYVCLGPVVAVCTPGQAFTIEAVVPGYAGLSAPAFRGDKQYIRTATGLLCVGGLGQDPDNATWEINLNGFFSNGRPLNLQLKRQDGKWIKAAAYARTWNKAEHVVDATGLTFEGGVLKGTLAITLNPDPWVPADHKPIATTATLEVTLKGRVLTGTFTGGVEPSGTGVTGEVLRL